jgi:hypothetical protein
MLSCEETLIKVTKVIRLSLLARTAMFMMLASPLLPQTSSLPKVYRLIKTVP